MDGRHACRRADGSRFLTALHLARLPAGLILMSLTPSPARRRGSLADLVPDVVLRLDADLRVVDVNQAGIAAGFGRGEHLGGDGLAGPALEAVRSAAEATMADGRERRAEVDIPGPSGRRWFEVRSVAESPAHRGVVLVMRDQTARRTAEERRREAEAEHAALLRLARAVSGDGPPRTVLEAAVGEAVGLLGGAAGALLRLREGTPAGTVVSAWQRGRPDPLLTGAPFPFPPEDPTASRLAAGRPARLDRIAPDHPHAARLTRAGVGAAVVVPVRAAGRVWGLLAVGAGSPADLPEGCESRLERVAGLAGHAVDVLEAREDLARRGAEEAALRRAATEVARADGLRAACDAVAREAAAMLAGDEAVLARLVPGGEAVLVGAWRTDGHPPRSEDPVIEAPPGSVLAAIAAGRPVAHAEGVPPLLPRRTGGDPGTRTALAALLRVEGAPWGALMVSSSRPQGFEPGARARLAAFAELAALGVANAEARAALAHQALTDPLTGLPNRRALADALEGEVARARRAGRPLALAVIDVDHFKAVNDEHGHEGGDRVLAEVAQRLRAQARAGEMVARMGGEEFAWILPDATRDAARLALERALRAVSGAPVPPAGRVTVSAGVADLETAGGPERLFRLADQSLYRAKQGGRDRVVVAGTRPAG